MRLLIRADASAETGSGHVMRCLALAQAWRRYGGKVVFVSEGLALGLAQMLSREDFSLDTENLCPEQWDIWHPDWVVIDGYHFDENYRERVLKSGFRLLAFDDFGEAKIRPCKLLLNQNPCAEEIAYVSEGETELLLGLRYCLIREEFRVLRNAGRVAAPKGSKILVTMGGADPCRLSERVIKALAGTSYEVTVIVGANNPRLKRLDEAAASSKSRVTVWPPSNEMARHMAWADLAVSAAGSTCIELACMGLPAIMISVAANQALLARGFSRMGTAVHLGHYDQLSDGDILSAIEELLASRIYREQMVRAGLALVDGNGADRVVEAMLRR